MKDFIETLSTHPKLLLWCQVLAFTMTIAVCALVDALCDRVRKK